MNGPAGLFPAQDSQRPLAGHIASEPSYVDAVQAKGQAGITVRGGDEKHGRALFSRRNKVPFSSESYMFWNLSFLKMLQAFSISLLLSNVHFSLQLSLPETTATPGFETASTKKKKLY